MDYTPSRLKSEAGLAANSLNAIASLLNHKGMTNQAAVLFSVQKVIYELAEAVEAEKPVDVMIVVEDGFVTNVYASRKELVSVEVIDKDTQDPDEQENIEERISDLEKDESDGLVFSVY